MWERVGNEWKSAQGESGGSDQTHYQDENGGSDSDPTPYIGRVVVVTRNLTRLKVMVVIVTRQNTLGQLR